MKQFLKSAARTAFIAGTLDIAAAMLRYYITTGKDPLAVPRFIASGVMGKEAFTGGLVTAAYGMIFHFMIASWWTLLYYLLYPKIPFLAKNKYISGTLYAFIVWCGMTFVVLPLSNVPRRPFDPVDAVIAVGILITCIGLPIAHFAHNHFAQQDQ